MVGLDGGMLILRYFCTNFCPDRLITQVIVVIIAPLAGG